MDRGVSTLISGMMSEERKMEVLTNNLANVSTVGFKRQQCVCSDFSTLMFNASSVKSQAAQNALQVANRLINKGQDGTTTMVTTVIMEDGPIDYTGNMLDVAIEGKGFFMLKTKDGIRYTRNGQFHLNEEDFVVDSDGNFLLSDSGPIKHETREQNNSPVELKIDKDGSIFDGSQNLGKLRIAKVDDPSQIAQTGNSQFVSATGQDLPNAADGFQINQGQLEQSNVSAVLDMAVMIEVSRTFETYQKLYQQYDQLRGRLIDSVIRS